MKSKDLKSRKEIKHKLKDIHETFEIKVKKKDFSFK